MALKSGKAGEGQAGPEPGGAESCSWIPVTPGKGRQPELATPEPLGFCDYFTPVKLNSRYLRPSERARPPLRPPPPPSSATALRLTIPN